MIFLTYFNHYFAKTLAIYYGLAFLFWENIAKFEFGKTKKYSLNIYRYDAFSIKTQCVLHQNAQHLAAYCTSFR